MPVTRVTSPGGPAYVAERRPSVEELRGIGLFGGLDDDVLEKLCATLRVEVVEAATVVFDEGEEGRALFVVLEGELEANRATKSGARVRLGVQDPGTWFGAMSLIDVMPRPHRVQALTRAVLLRVRASDLDSLYRSNTKAYTLLVMNIARQLSRELRIVSAQLAELLVPKS
jgi:CRP-like cAMP-binding protein